MKAATINSAMKLRYSLTFQSRETKLRPYIARRNHYMKIKLP